LIGIPCLIFGVWPTVSLLIKLAFLVKGRAMGVRCTGVAVRAGSTVSSLFGFGQGVIWEAGVDLKCIARFKPLVGLSGTL
jgi:hypothetical protein